MKQRTFTSAPRKAARVIAMVLVLAVIFSVSVISASAYEVKGRTLAQVLKMNGATYYQWLSSHINDKYYNTTPYAHADHRNPNGDCQGANGALDTPGEPALNCMGFVWHALYMPTKMSGGNTGMIPAYGNGGWYGLYTGYNLSRRYFNSKRDLLASGYAEPGDIIWMFVENEHVADDSNHIAIYMGDGHSDRVWHAVKAGTKFGYINPDYEEYLVIKSGAIRKLATPALKSVTNIAAGPKITWNKVKGASYYRVFVKSGSSWKLLGQTRNNYFVDKKAKSGKTYTYTVRCVDSSGKPISDFNRKGLTNTFYATPKGFSADCVEGTGVKFSWGKVAGAPKYRVMRKTEGGSYVTVANTTATSIVDKKATPGKTYYYTVRVLDKNNKFASSYITPLKAYYITDVPKINNSLADNSGLTLKWNAVKGAEQYAVYKKTSSGWKRIGLSKKNKLVIAKPDKDVDVAYTVRCMNAAGNAFTSSFDKTGYTTKYVDMPKITRMEGVESGVKLTWNANTAVPLYYVYRKDAGKWVKIAETTDSTYVDTDATVGNTYEYTLRCVSDGKFISTYNTKGWAMTYAAAPVVTATETDNGILISWNKAAGAATYRVFVKKDGAWTKLADVKGTSHLYADGTTPHTFTVRCMDSSKWFNSWYDTEGVTAPEIIPEESTEAPAKTGVTEPAADEPTEAVTEAPAEPTAAPETEAATE